LPVNPCILVLGGGTAGLGAAYLAASAGVTTDVIEKLHVPGGLALTRQTPDGYYYDLGGHRYYSPSHYLVPFLKKLLGDELILTPRKSRFYLNRRFFDYPVRFTDVAMKLPITHSLRMLKDYLAEKARAHKNRKEDSYEDWMIHRFGRALYEFNFENYTRKVWGVDPKSISADWASLRIKGLSLGKIISEFLSHKGDIATLVDRFLYPKHGIGQISHYLERKTRDLKGKVYLSEEVVQVKHDGKRITKVMSMNGKGEKRNLTPEWVASSIDLDLFIKALDPPPPREVMTAAMNLTYRSLVILFVRINSEKVTDDSWIYFPDESVPFGRWHEPKNWSIDMVPDSRHSSLVVEFFADRGDAFWNASKEELLSITLKTGKKLGLLDGKEIGSAEKYVFERAYPFWDLEYRKTLSIIFDYLDRFKNLSLIGRNGRFYYCTIDESLISGFAASANFLEGVNTGPDPLPIEIPDNALPYLGLSEKDLEETPESGRWSRND
jgi:protoporphyrinogen oxidase